MNELHQKILDAARDEVASTQTDVSTGKRYESYKQYETDMTSQGEEGALWCLESDAALLAMEKQAEFFRHIFFIGWKVVDNIDGEPIYEQGKQSPQQTELELYNIWGGK